ncbi:TPA: TcpQ domain-containing protein [Salmonella enterica subsp. enterica serovar Wedding]|nr:TcpQ domain-containing protein [Salmonella enterica subsp. enterica serovar Wedding]HBM0102665.1 TcpQ domain-containing protein [Salmonella enterica subsp. enterica serovar Wedding]
MSINTYTFLCPGLFLVLAGCTQSPAASSARDAAFSGSLKPVAPADIWQRSPEVTREGRYTLVSVKSADAQREPLNQLIDITMPVSLVNSVGDGFRYLLFQSGYSLCGRYGADFAELLNRPLPAVQRRLGPVRLSEALQVVAGPAWRMTVDEVNREVCFVLRDAYLAQARPASSQVTAAPAVSASAAGASSAGVQTRQSETHPLPAVPVLTASGTGGKGTVKIPSVSPSSSTATVNQMATTGGHAAASPSLTPATTDNKSSSAAVAASATSQATPSPAVAATGRNPFRGKDLTGKTTATPVVSTASPSPVAPTASSPAPALSTPVPKLIGTPVKALPSGPEWKAAAGITLQESLTAWAAKADCPNGGHWVVIWQTPVDYRIEAPLTFRGSFESALDQVFDLYRPAEKRLYAEANRAQCLVSVTGRPVDR